MIRNGARGFGSSNSGTSFGSSSRNEDLQMSEWDTLFKDTEYWDLYQSILRQYSNPVPNTLAGYFTGSNALNEYDRVQARNQALTDLASQMRADTHNSPVNQASLERQAGLNPDLTGISGVGETDSTQFNPHNPVAPSASADTQSALNVFTSILSSSLGMYQQIKQIQNLSLTNKGLILDNASKEVGIGSSLDSTIRDFITNNMAKGFSGQQNMSMNDLKDMFAEQFEGNPTLSRIARRRFDSVSRSSNYDSSRAAYEKIMADQKAMQDFEGEMVKFQFLANKHRFKAEIAKSKSDETYYNTLDPAEAANAVNRENSNRGWLDKWRNGFYRKMYEDFKYRGSDLAGLILISSGNPQWSGIFGVGLNQADRDLSSFFSKDWLNPNDSVVSGINKLWNFFNS